MGHFFGWFIISVLLIIHLYNLIKIAIEDGIFRSFLFAIGIILTSISLIIFAIYLIEE